MGKNFMPQPQEFMHKCPVCNYELTRVDRIAGVFDAGPFSTPKCPQCGEKTVPIEKRNNILDIIKY